MTDDTIAIQRCLDAAHRTSREFTYGMSWQSMYHEVVFPAGTYVLSNMLRVSNAMIVRGEGTVVLKQTNPHRGIIDNHWALRMLFQNLTFDGGWRQLHLFTANSAGAQITVRDCTFRGAEEYAISCVMRRKPNAENLGEAYGYFKQEQVGDAEYRYDFVDDLSQPFTFNSTVLHVDRCRFERCRKVIQTNADMGTLSNCKVETHPDMNGAAICADGITKLENIDVLAHVTPGKSQRLIDHVQLGLVVQNVTLKTSDESTQDMPLVYCHIKYRDTSAGNAQYYVVVDGCHVQCARSPERAIIHCLEVPNSIALRNCLETSGSPVDGVGFARPFDADYFKGITPDGLKYIVAARNSPNIRTQLPAPMRPFADQPLPEKILDAARKLETQPLDDVSMARLVKTRLSATDFQVPNDGKADATESLRQAVSAAAKHEQPELLLPSGHYRISGTIDLPPDLSLRAVGSAYIDGSGDIVAFRVPQARRVAFHNLMFGNLRTALEITAPADAESQVLIDRCQFSEISGMAVRCGTPGLPVAQPNRLRLRITDSAFYYNCRQLFETNAAQAVFDNSWAITDPRMNGVASIVNRGSLVCRNIAGNPVCDQATHDMRWIDNHHRLVTDCFRFGGEAGGICLVNQRPSNPKDEPFILVQNGWLYALGNERRKRSAIYLEQLPAFVAVQTNTGCNGGLQRMIALSDAAIQEGKAHNRTGTAWFFTSGNTIPVNDPLAD